MTQMLWWQTGVIYQIYPRSFKDTTGNGIGDLSGVIEKLDYLSDTLGVDAIWLSPFYPSPMADFGYDVANYVDVHPMFGDLQTFDELVLQAHGVVEMTEGADLNGVSHARQARLDRRRADQSGDRIGGRRRRGRSGGPRRTAGQNGGSQQQRQEAAGSRRDGQKHGQSGMNG